MFNKFCLLARKGLPFSYPIQHGVPASILDLGTSTGIWAIHVAKEYVLLLDSVKQKLVLNLFKNPPEGPCHGG